jgi:hypothetical protein
MLKQVVEVQSTRISIIASSDRTTYQVHLYENRIDNRSRPYLSVWLCRRTEKSKRWHMQAYAGNTNLMTHFDPNRRFTAETPEEAVNKRVNTLHKLGESMQEAANTVNKVFLR